MEALSIAPQSRWRSELAFSGRSHTVQKDWHLIAGSDHRALALGCQHYLLKPIRAEHLTEKIQEALAPRSPLFRDRAPTIADLGLDLASYNEIAPMLAHHAVEGIKLPEAGVGSELPNALSANSEGAGIVGAARVKNRLDRLAGGGQEMAPEQLADEHRELRLELEGSGRALPYEPEAAAYSKN